MGKRYTKQEIDQIQILIQEGFTNQEIATRLGRTEAGVRNIRHRTKLKTETKTTLESLRNDRYNLQSEISKLKHDTASLQLKKQDIEKVLQHDEEKLNEKLERALRKMKHHKPELFYISGQDQLAQLTAQLAGPFLKWLISE
jgi:predicted transcriptional regulator